MSLFKRSIGFVVRLLAPVEVHYTPDTMSYHSAGDDRELRFSPTSALRRYY
jgi:hypothetical protein